MSTKLNDNDDLVVNDDAEDNVSLVENSDNISANDNDDEMKDDDQTVTSVGLTIENPMISMQSQISAQLRFQYNPL